MLNSNELKKILLSIDGKGYPTYKRTVGKYKFGAFVLSIDRVQSDPFASPSKIRVIVLLKDIGFPSEVINNKYKRRTVVDFLTRNLERSINSHIKNKSGSGNSGLLSIGHCGQEILERTSAVINEDNIEIRMEIGMSAIGRRISGKAAVNILFDILPKIVEESAFYKNIDQEYLKKQIDLTLDQEYIRQELEKKGLVAFISNGSVLPRESGVSDKPLSKEAVLFKSPESFEVEFDLPNLGKVRGMGIPKGITLIVGGGYHGKSTLLNALELGVYNHKINDGRELIITRDDAVKIRAEDGRSIEKVDISSFINNLPNNKDTYQFSTENASGSTSQAANVIEALEIGSKLLLIDEDTSATNFMIRDERMKKLVVKSKEPITPFIDKVRELYKEHGVSSIIVVGGSGDYFDVADRVIMMDEYIPKDVTEQAKKIASLDSKEEIEVGTFGSITKRVPLKSSLELTVKHTKIKPKEKQSIIYGKNVIDLSSLEQLVDVSQVNSIAVMIDFLVKKIFDDNITISEAVEELFDHVNKFGLNSISFSNIPSGKLSLPRKHELCAAINRYRGLKIKN